MNVIKYAKSILVALTVLSAFPFVAHAAPAVSAITGTFTHGTNIIVGGTGFGTKSTAAPVLWDAVENQSSYSGLSNGTTIPTGGGYPWADNSDSTGHMKFDNVGGEQRGKSTACYKASNSYKGHMAGVTMPSSHYVYVSWWWRANADVSSGDHSSKFLRMSNSSNITDFTFSWTQIQAYAYNTNGGGYGNQTGNIWADYHINTNAWNFMEAWFDSVNQTFDLYQNRQLSKHGVWTGMTTFDFNYVWKVGFDGGGNTPPDITQWMDDIYVDRTFQRVMICNASTYSASTHCEMQIPNTTWNNTQLQVRVNQGSFANGATGYVYVIDAAGAASQGGTASRVIFGSGSSSQGSSVPPGNLR